MILFIIILTLFIISTPAQAQEFTPYQNNPVVTVGTKGIYQPTVLKEENGFSIWYSIESAGRGVIARMKSINGIDWYDPAFLTLSKTQNINDPFIFKINNKYDMYYGATKPNDGIITLWKSTSVDGTLFIPENEKEILHAEYPWEGNSVSCPTVIQENGVYYLFYAGNGNDWNIGMATSPDGETWHKCTDNPIVKGAGPSIVKYKNTFYLYFHSALGLESIETTNLNNCDTVWTNKHILPVTFNDPAPVVVDNNLWIYGAAPTATGWSIILSGNTHIEPPSYPIVIIPGMFASWNKDAILHNLPIGNSSWTLNANVSEYDAIITTLKNKGKIENKDFYIFPYDWRAPITDTANNLNIFLSTFIWNKNPYQPVQLVGHSLGGVISSVFASKNPSKPIKKIITAGSPLLGAVQAYKPLAGGEIDRENTLMWMAEKLILLLNKSRVETDKDTVARMLPIMKDLIPIFSYLKDESGSPLSSSLSNTLLPNIQVNPTISQFSMGGSGYQTLAGYRLGARTPQDILFNIYNDGHPQSLWKEEGDGVTLLKSSLNQINSPPTSNHGEIIYSKENIKTILSQLSIQTTDADIPAGKATTIFPAILAFIQSPATLEIEHNGSINKENEGMIWIQNAENGMYTLTVTGVESGQYTVSIWLIGETDDKWIQFTKTTSIGSKDRYNITFDTISGGLTQEYVSPTPTSTPTKIPTAKPTIKPTVKPTCKPVPSKTPTPTKKPTPTPKPHNHKDDKNNMRDIWNRIFELLRRYISNHK